MKGFATSTRRGRQRYTGYYVDDGMSSRSPQVAKFKPGNGESRTEIHRGSREATARERGEGKGGRQDGVAQWVPCCRYVSLGTGPMVN